MNLYRSMALATVAAAALILTGCNQASGGAPDTPPVIKVDPNMIKNFEDGSTAGVTLDLPTVDTVTNALAAALSVSISTDLRDKNHSIREFDGAGNQISNTDTLIGDWDAGGFDNGAQSLKFQYGTSVDSGRVGLTLDPVTFPATAGKTGFTYSVNVPDANGGIGTIVVLTGDDGKDYSSSPIAATAAPTAGAYNGTWTYSLMDPVWATYKVPFGQFQDSSSALLTDALTAGVKITKVKFVFRIVSGALGIDLDKAYDAYLDNVAVY